MRPDPARRPDGLCARFPACRNRLPEITPRHRRYGGEALAKDPFCSTECCKAYHRVDSAFKPGEGVFSNAAV